MCVRQPSDPSEVISYYIITLFNLHCRSVQPRAIINIHLLFGNGTFKLIIWLAGLSVISEFLHCMGVRVLNYCLRLTLVSYIMSFDETALMSPGFADLTWLHSLNHFKYYCPLCSLTDPVLQVFRRSRVGCVPRRWPSHRGCTSMHTYSSLGTARFYSLAGCSGTAQLLTASQSISIIDHTI
jgi:hypothetical protein